MFQIAYLRVTVQDNISPHSYMVVTLLLNWYSAGNASITASQVNNGSHEQLWLLA